MRSAVIGVVGLMTWGCGGNAVGASRAPSPDSDPPCEHCIVELANLSSEPVLGFRITCRADGEAVAPQQAGTDRRPRRERCVPWFVRESQYNQNGRWEYILPAGRTERLRVGYFPERLSTARSCRLVGPPRAEDDGSLVQRVECR
ncbi:MAG: hypothetical protein R3E98_08565 [Gemmatimonadota bacterium]